MKEVKKYTFSANLNSFIDGTLNTQTNVKAKATFFAPKAKRQFVAVSLLHKSTYIYDQEILKNKAESCVLFFQSYSQKST